MLANCKVLPQHKVNLFYVYLVKLNRLESKIKATTKVIKQILLIYFVHLYCQALGKSTTFGILQAFLQIFFERTNERDSSL